MCTNRAPRRSASMSSVYCPAPARLQSRSRSSKRRLWFFFCRLFPSLSSTGIFLHQKRGGDMALARTTVHGFEDKVKQGRAGIGGIEILQAKKKNYSSLLGN